MIALALERYIIICRGVHAASILKTKRRKILYSVTLVASVAVPSIYLVDHVLNEAITSEKYQINPMGMQVSRSAWGGVITFEKTDKPFFKDK